MFFSADAIFNFFNAVDTREYFGEPVTQLQHALQCADFAVRAYPDEPEMAIAALLHDIGHLCAPNAEPMRDLSTGALLGTMHHEDLGADYLRSQGFSEKVAQLVRGHVDAKRYNMWRSGQYAAALSPASRATLLSQGGVMSDAEAHAFEAHPLFERMRMVRSWDEAAKDPTKVVAPLETYRDMLESHVNSAKTAS